MKKIQPVRGTHDLIGKDLVFYKKIEKIICKMAHDYDFTEIITPIFESSELFQKPLGQHSDIVLKEMYTFEDRNHSLLTLRPEYTTPMIRAAITNNLFNHLPVKLFGMGPMFRRERPQKGRFRQFNQINFEVLGSSDSFVDAEIIFLASDFLKSLNLHKKIKLYLNSLGDLHTLSQYKGILSSYFEKYKNDLSNESQSKIETNPLRILDSKNPKDIIINSEAPKVEKYYSISANKIFDDVKNLLTKTGIIFETDSNLVRGLDYYCHTVFEFKTEILGSQNTIIGGGRYDGLVKALGGPDIPGLGWACGIERLIMMMDEVKIKKPFIKLIIIKEQFKEYGLDLLLKLRKQNFIIKYDYKYNLKKSLKEANELNIKFAIIIGENETQNNVYTVKNLLSGNQKIVNYEELTNILNS